ncbi:hypothetical protein B0I35DRAFT_188639 [Stachybotrys elegans]|uniref:C3H1-type domain-containing protein n=1 Tax=Stachybotrys elegans TaxID=80388 RepID=A0A8K0WUR6_9HYPO|nr:hypothetical protein B0I35DRAFT_188639 [Stachybotrys elegans]
MPVCRFFQQGYCKFGNNCRNEHPSGNNNRNQTTNRFGGGGNVQNVLEKYSTNIETIEKDLTTERPQWILSAYAPGRGCPEQLFGGYPREQSFEEVRLHYMMGKASGNEQQALNEAQHLYQNAEEQMQNALRNLNQAAQFIADGENRHPNRLDICQQGTQGAPFGEFAVGKHPLPSAAPAQNNPFGAPSAPSAFGGAPASGSAFGQPSALGQRPNPFGTPAFGQPSQPGGQQPSAFGQPAQGSSPFGQAPQTTTAFGQPSTLGAKPNPFGAPAFGQPSQPAAQPSPFGQPSQPSAQGSTFGQPSQLGAQGSAFGQPSALGQKPNPFGAPAASTASPFGAPSAPAGAAPAAANPFGAPSANTANPFGSGGGATTNNANPFGSPANAASNAAPAANPFGSNAPQNNNQSPFGGNAFGQNTQSSSPFGQAGASTASPFANANQNTTPSAPNPFGQPQQSAGPFGAQQQANQPANHFQQGNANPFGQQGGSAAPAQSTSNNPYPPESGKQHPPIESYSSKGMDGRLTMFKGKPVTYKDGKPGIQAFNGSWTRICFPDGPPGYSRDTEAAEYDDKSKAQWEAFAQTGRFADGLMPELPPPRLITTWDF